MIILGIETSCDDTGIAVVQVKSGKLKIKSNTVSSQTKLHAKYGGVYPTLAKREHRRNLPVVLKKALKDAKNPKVNLIAVTVGPGLEPCLWEGVNFAKELGKKIKVPVVPANHVEGHILANYFTERPKRFPAVCLTVAGGHTQLTLMTALGKYKIVGETRDDAAGECFDKTARILGLSYPGGPAIAELARLWKSQITNSKFQTSSKFQITNSRHYGIKLPRPMMYQKNYDFSFSGLKTAVLYHHKSQPPKIRKSKAYIQATASEIQQAIVDVLIHKTMKAAKEYKAKSIILGGGVAANEELRKQMKLKIGNWKLEINFLVPPKSLCTDNAAMIAAAGYYTWLRSKTKIWRNIKADANLVLK